MSDGDWPVIPSDSQCSPACPTYDLWCGMFLALHTISGVLRLSGAGPSPGVSQAQADTTEPVCAVCEASLDRATPLPDTRRRDLSPRNKAPPFLYRSLCPGQPLAA